MAHHPSSDRCLAPVERGPDGDETPGFLNKANLERLGRQRPVEFRTAVAEFGFVFSVVTSMMMAEYFISGFNIILPEIARALKFPDSERTWPAGVPNLTTAALLLPFARLCDMYGGRIVFLGGHAWLLVWSLICGFSVNPNMLIVCRAMQGVASGAFLPAGLGLLGQVYRPGPRKNLIYGLYGALACVGFYIGIILGALTGQLLSWRWYFWIGAILVLVVLVSGFLSIPRNLGDGDPSIKMDWWGLCTVVPGLVLVVFALTDGGGAPRQWQTPYIYVTFVVGALLLCAFVYIEGWAAAEPLLPSDLFKAKYMKRLSLALFCAYGTFGLFLLYASYYVETVLHTTPLQAAAWFTPLALGGVILAVVGGFVLHRIPGRILLVISGSGFLLGVLLFALMPAQSGPGQGPSTSFLYWAYVFPAMVAETVGVDITFNVTNVFITTSVPKRLQAGAGALVNSLLYLGLAFWLGVGELAISTSVAKQGEGELGPRKQYEIAFWLGVGLSAVTLCLYATVNIGLASADMTADEKARLDADYDRG